MKTVIKLLKKELREWKQQYASEKQYYKGLEEWKCAKSSFKECEKHIAHLEEAIKILNANCRKAKRINP